MSLGRLLLALAGLACFTCAVSADQSSPAPAPQSVLFHRINEVVTLHENAAIFDQPGGKAIFKVRTRSRVAAQAVSEDGRWWEIAQPNGSVGYVTTTSLVGKP